MKRNAGLTLLEVVIYTGIFAIVMVVITLFFIGILRATISVRAEQTAVTNAALALRAMELELRHSDRLYTQTSVFDNDAGQLSLRTPKGAPTDHVFAYTDFYLDNGVIYMRRDDGVVPIALTTGDVEITVLRFERKTSGSVEGIRLSATAQPLNVPIQVAEARTLRTFVVPRSFTP